MWTIAFGVLIGFWMIIINIALVVGVGMFFEKASLEMNKGVHFWASTKAEQNHDK